MRHAEPLATEMSLEVWAELPEDAEGELASGHLEEEEVPDRLHEAAVRWLLVELALWARAHGARVFGSELKLAIGHRTGRKPDLSVWLSGSPRSHGEDTLQRQLPDLVIEVLSPRPRDQQRDRVVKPEEYARAGIRWYWLVDPRARTFEVLELGQDGRYVHAAGGAEGRLRPPGFKELALDLDALWSEVDAELSDL